MCGWRKGDAGRIAVEENGARYFADLGQGQKTGWYYDQRDNRAFMAGLAKGRTVLDAYCYSGGFGILAAKAGAKEVICLDSSEAALKLAEDSAAANRLSLRAVKADVFEELERLAGAERTLRHRGRRSAAFREIQKGSRAGRQGLSQAGAAGGRRHRAGRHPAAGLLLAQHAAGTLCGGMCRGNLRRPAARRP